MSLLQVWPLATIRPKEKSEIIRSNLTSSLIALWCWHLFCWPQFLSVKLVVRLFFSLLISIAWQKVNTSKKGRLKNRPLVRKIMGLWTGAAGHGAKAINSVHPAGIKSEYGMLNTGCGRKEIKSEPQNRGKANRRTAEYRILQRRTECRRVVSLRSVHF